MHKQAVSINRMKYTPAKKALIVVLCITSGLLSTQQNAQSHGFYIVDKPQISPPRPPFPPYPRPPRPIHRHLPLELNSVHINTKIEDQIAQTTIEQTFYNPSKERIEGTYMFPIPLNAKLTSIQMEVNGKMTKGELLDAKKAKELYENIVRNSKDPALMEYSGQSMFQVRLFPIEPGKEKKVKMKYKELLTKDGQITSYKFPLRYEKFLNKPIKKISVKVLMNTEKQFRTIYSPSHEITIERKGKRSAILKYEKNKVSPDTNFEILFSTKSEEESPISFDFITHREKDLKKGYYAMLVSPGIWESDQLVPKDVTFVIDSSGSMRVKKLDQAKDAINFCLSELNERDRFEIIRYSTELESLFGKLKQAKKQNLNRAKEFIKNLNAGGGTAIEEALLKAISTQSTEKTNKSPRQKQIIFITDGRPTIGETRTDKIIDRLSKIIEKNKSSPRIFTFGIGTDINTKLLDLVSQKTKASTEYVLPEENIEDKISRFYSKVAQPVMTEIKIKTDDNVRLSEQHPKDLPDLFKGDQLILIGRYQYNESEKEKVNFTISGNIGVKKVNLGFSKNINNIDTNQFIARLWGTRRVGYLLEEIRLHGENNELKNSVVSLARKWGIVTPYTSYLILEDEESRNVPIERQSIGNRITTPKDSQTTIKEAASMRRKLEANSFLKFRNQVSGDAAVAASRSSNQLKRANHPEVFRDAYNESQYGISDHYEQQETKTMAGKTFFKHAQGWIDSRVPLQEHKRSVKIRFGSDEYFKIINQNVNNAKWLSLGTNIQVVIREILYEVVNYTK